MKNLCSFLTCFFILSVTIISGQNGDIQIDGKIGIGIDPSTATEPVQIKSNNLGNAIQFFDFGGEKEWVFKIYNNGNFGISENGHYESITIEQLGNIGIGATNPSAKLEVAGDVRVAGKISNVSNPEAPQDAATKSYVDQLLLEFALASIVDTSVTLQALLNVGTSPISIIAAGMDSSQFSGLNYQGGIIFLMRSNGTGLVAAPMDLTDARWGCYQTLINGANSDLVGDGAQNTLDILAECSEADIAAKLCNDLNLNNFNDWFLPSKDELNLMWLYLADSDSDGQNGGIADPGNIGGFSTATYYTSTQFFTGSARTQRFDNGAQNLAGKNGTSSVRAIRAF